MDCVIIGIKFNMFYVIWGFIPIKDYIGVKVWNRNYNPYLRFIPIKDYIGVKVYTLYILLPSGFIPVRNCIGVKGRLFWY